MRAMVLESGSSPCPKRSRDPEDEVYLDNFHSHKRYLSEIMASSLNGLRVEDSLSDNLIESPVRSEGMCYLRDDISLQYSPMSEDSDEARYGETMLNTSIGHSDSLPTSPVSPHRHQRPLSSLSSAISSMPNPSLGCAFTAVSCCQPRPRGPDSEGRFPSSPSDICQSPDLRRAALLRSLQMRSQPPAQPSFELPRNPAQEPMQSMEAEEQPFSNAKSLVDEPEFPNLKEVPNLFVEESSVVGMRESDPRQEKQGSRF